MAKSGATARMQRSTRSKQIDWIKQDQAESVQNLRGIHRMPFVKGQSGNPRGRPVGARGKKTLAREAALRAEAQAKVGRLVVPKRRPRTRRPRAKYEPMRAPGRPAAPAAGDRDDLRAVAAFLGADWLTLMQAADLLSDRGAEAEADDLL